ncbi:MAG: S8 family serine peptidase [Candidatus Gracilibacteria bacterium]|nr:S8 family serine peptidase [Candidatus Gracilibacteria bacterium]
MKRLKKQISYILLTGLLVSNFSFMQINSSFATNNSQTKSAQGFLDNGTIDSNKLKNNKDILAKTAGIIIKFKASKLNLKNSASIQSLNTIANSKGLKLLNSISDKNISSFEIKDKTQSIDKLINNLRKEDYVEIAQPNYIYQPNSINSNDTNRDNLWALDNAGQSIESQTGLIGADMSWNKASAIFSGTTNTANTGVIVAVLDSGVAYNHPELINQMRDGTSCKNENGAYLGGCIHGYDFASNDKDPKPVTETHGTHVAGSIAAEMNNSKGIIGVNPKAKIMALRMGDSSFTTTTILKSIYFAKENGAKIINASFGASGISAFDELEYQAIKDFTDAGGLFIAAAGNNAGNNDNISDRFFPASFGINNYTDSLGYLTGTTSGSGIYTYTGITNLISVAATDNRDNLASFSNYGANTVNIGAPGVSIYSSVLSNITAFSGANVSNFTTGGLNNNWGNFSSTGVLWTDLAYPYATGADTYIEKQVDTSSLYNPSLNFRIWCDAGSTGTGYDNYSTDYTSLSFSTGGSFSEYYKYNYTSNSLVHYSNGGYYSDISISLNNYMSSNFKFRFNWHTDNIQNAEEGCFIYNLSLDGTDDGLNNGYAFLDGTSMATPQVVGLASLAWSYKPNLSGINIKNAILNNGDSTLSLSGKTTSGNRINAFKTLLSITDTGSITQLKAYFNSGKTTELSSGSIIANPSLYLEWLDSTNAGAIDKYKIQIKDNSGNLLEINYSSGNTLNSSDILLGTGILTSAYTGTSLKYVVSPILYDGREGQSRELNLVYDNINPVFSNLNYINNQKTTNSSIVLTGTINDSNLSGTLLVNGTGVSLNSSGIFSKSIDLVPGINHISLSVSDKAGNNTGTGIDLIKIGTAPKVYSSITDIGNIKLEFNSDFAGTGVFIYGTGGNLDNSFTGNYLTYHSFNIPYLNDDETYYYRAYYLRDGYASLISETGSIKTPNSTDLLANTGSLESTGTLNLTNASRTGTNIDGTGTIILHSETGSNLISIPRGIEVITASGTWDKVIQAPHQVMSSGTINLSGYTRNTDLTFKIGSDSDSLTFSGGNVAVSLNVGNSYDGKTLKIYRSEDTQSSFVYHGECLVASGICSFTTTKFSDFAILIPGVLDSVPDSFAFTAVSSAELSTPYTSNTITVTGINTSTGITASAGTLIINGIDSGTSGTVSSGTTVSVKLTSSASYSSVVSSTISIGGIAANYSVTTKSAPVVSSGGGGGGGGGSITPTCLDTQLVCTNGVYYRKSGVSCNDGNLGKTCTLDSTGTTNTGSLKTDMIVDNNLQNLLEQIKVDPSLDKTYTIQSTNLKDLTNHFSKKYVDELISRKVIKGYSDNTFKPDNAITRAEYLSILMKALNISVDSSLVKSSFSDISDGTWIIKYTELAKTDFDISTNSDKFRPNDFITRAEALAMLFKISKLSLQTNSSNTFKDSDLENWMTKYTIKAKSLGLVKGQDINGKTYFKPNSNITRAETSKIVVNLLKIMGK